jgi:hypothetical protein
MTSFYEYVFHGNTLLEKYYLLSSAYFSFFENISLSFIGKREIFPKSVCFLNKLQPLLNNRNNWNMKESISFFTLEGI